MKRNLITLIIVVTAAVTHAADIDWPYRITVYDFEPAPGQFCNVLPQWLSGETKEAVLKRVENELCGYYDDGDPVQGMVSLGAYGGYIVFGFDRPVVNVPGEYDFQILGNALKGAETSANAGSSEPGIVMVSADDNGNGLPDDTWYELAGSEYNNPRTQHHFAITYYKPGDDHVPTKVGRNILDAYYIRWTSNDRDSLQEGYLEQLSFHAQSYWPGWLDDVTLTFSGTKLPCNYYDESGNGSYIVQHFYDWGYVDNRPDYRWDRELTDSIRSNCNLGFKIDWAVDADGNHVSLKKIDFIKVYTAINQKCGWLGETSTEVAGAFDVHPDAVLPDDPVDGDLNGDGNTNAGDVSALYEAILSGNSDPRYDLNSDSSVNAGDVSALYEIILSH